MFVKRPNCHRIFPVLTSQCLLAKSITQRGTILGKNIWATLATQIYCLVRIVKNIVQFQALHNSHTIYET